MSQRVKHGARTGYMRMQRIFRYYDADRDQGLRLQDMFQMRKDIRSINKKNIKESEAEEKAVNDSLVHDFEALGIDLKSYTDPSLVPNVTLDQMIKSISKLNQKGMRGTSSLFRFHFNFFRRLLYPIGAVPESDSNRCTRHRDADFTVAAHTCVLDSRASVTRSEVDDDLLAAAVKNNDASSVHYSDPANPSLQVILLVHHMASLMWNRTEGVSSETNNSSDWINVTAQEKRRRLNLIHEVCSRAKKIFLSESRIPRVSSPCLVFGDTHGNLSDVLSYEKLFWKQLPLMPHTFVFLGDYVDRGLQSVEVFLYMLSLKCLSATHVIMLRGNHETPGMHLQFTFREECVHKFGDDGKEMWDRLCAVMDCMPVAATIDDHVFCCHGGVPTTESRINHLLSMPAVMHDAEIQYAPAWQIMWNDPVEDELMSEIRSHVGSSYESSADGSGFTFNVKRGTGYIYNEQALLRFNQVNKTTHLIRAHELVMKGFLLHFGGKAMTVFSSSHYVGENNTSACIMIQDGLLTPVQITT